MSKRNTQQIGHRSKVAIRRALQALARLDAEMSFNDPMTEAMGASGMVADEWARTERKILRKVARASTHAVRALSEHGHYGGSLRDFAVNARVVKYSKRERERDAREHSLMVEQHESMLAWVEGGGNLGGSST